MDNCFGIILTKNNDNNFGYLCKYRSSYMLPFGGRYRLIDIIISNLVNNGVKTVALYTGDKVRSVIDHLGDGKPWELNRKFSGLSLFPPEYSESGHRTGEIGQLFSTERFFKELKDEYIFITNSNVISKVDLVDAYNKFRESNAHATLIYRRQENHIGQFRTADKLHIDNHGNLVNKEINYGFEHEYNYYMEMCFIKKSVFLEVIREAMEKGDVKLFKDALFQSKQSLNINTYEYEGHMEFIDDLSMYYRANMNLLDRGVYRETFFEGGRIYTKPKDEPPTLYKEGSIVENSLIANGCVIEGLVENSIIFRGVKIGKNAVIKNSIIMQKTDILENAVISNSIVDKFSMIDKGVRIYGTSDRPYIVEKYGVVRKD